MSEKEKIKTLTVVAVFIALFCVFLLTSRVTPEKILQQPNPTDNPIGKTHGVREETKKIVKTAILEINGVKYETGIKEEISVYDFMSKLRSEGKISFKEKNYIGMGKFIEELNGIKGNGDKFWIYYVNSKKAKIGISNYKINSGDVVSWRYEKDIN